MQKAKPSKKARAGRPSLEVKKKPFQVMLDPRYIEHFKKTAGSKKVQPQELARMALNAFVPDPFNPLTMDPEIFRNLFKKDAKAR